MQITFCLDTYMSVAFHACILSCKRHNKETSVPHLWFQSVAQVLPRMQEMVRGDLTPLNHRWHPDCGVLAQWVDWDKSSH